MRRKLPQLRIRTKPTSRWYGLAAYAMYHLPGFPDRGERILVTGDANAMLGFSGNTCPYEALDFSTTPGRFVQ